MRMLYFYTVYKQGVFTILLFLACFFCLTEASRAVPYYDNLSAPTNRPGVSDAGPRTYWNLQAIKARGGEDILRFIPAGLRFDQSNTSPNNLIQTLKRRQAFFSSSRQITNYLLRYCSDGANCPLWKSRRITASGSDWRRELAFNNHLAWGNPGESNRLSPDATLAFNVRIWRENPTTGEFQLILRRTVGGSSRSQGNTDQENCRIGGSDTLLRSLQNWWTGCTENANPAGIYTRAPALRGGPLGPHFASLQQCLHPGNPSNPRQGQLGSSQDIVIGPVPRSGGGEAEGIGRTPRVESRVLPRLPLGNTRETMGGRYKTEGDCYFEGRELGRPFTWNKTNGIPGNVYANDLNPSTPVNILTWIRNRASSNIEGLAARMRNNQFGMSLPSGNWRSNRSGVVGSGLKEGVWLRWSIPRKGATANLNYRIEGIPGLAYAVHVVRLSPREEILPFRGSGPFYKKNQYFKAFIPNLSPSYEDGGSFEGARPNSQLELEVPEEDLVIHESLPVKAKYDIKEDQGNTDEAYVFPTSYSFWHYTPQYRYSGYSGLELPLPVYQNSDPPYVDYSNLCPSGPSLFPQLETCYTSTPTPIAGSELFGSTGNLGNPAKADNSEYINQLSSPSQGIDPASSIGDSLDFSLETSWNQPTLLNPCPDSVFSLTAGWIPETRAPYDPTRTVTDPETGIESPDDACPREGEPPIANSWDDALMAEMKADLVWPGKINGDTPEVYQAGDARIKPEYMTVNLRCPPEENDTDNVISLTPEDQTNDPDGSCKPMPNSVRPEGFLKPQFGEQRVDNIPDDADFSYSPVRAVFKAPNLTPNNTPDLQVYARGQEDPFASVGVINPISGQLEVNICDPGKPRGGNIFPRVIPEGDHNCRSPLTEWSWAPGTSEQERIDRCSLRENGITYNNRPKREWWVERDWIVGNNRNQGPASERVGLGLKRAISGYAGFPTRIPYRGLLPGERAGDNERQGQVMGCAYRPQHEVRNQQSTVQVRESSAAGYSRYPAEGPARWCRAEQSATVLNRGDTSVPPGYDGKGAKARADGWKKPCYFKWSFPSAPGGDDWNLENSTICRLSSNNVTLTKESPRPGYRCFWKRWRQWSTRVFDDGSIDINDWGPSNWPNVGWVYSGFWEMQPIYDRGPYWYSKYIQPGYSKIQPEIGLRSTASIMEAGYIPVAGGEDVNVNQGLIVKLGDNGTVQGFWPGNWPSQIGWHLQASYFTRPGVPINYEQGVSFKTDAEDAAYVSVGAPRFAG